MMVVVTSAGALELRDAENFRDFKVLVERPGADHSFIAEALKGVAELSEDGKHAWVSQAALCRWQGRDQPGPWVASFNKMVESVRRFGWVDEARGALRGHIEMA